MDQAHTMRRVALLIFLALLMAGCAISQPQESPTYTDADESPTLLQRTPSPTPRTAIHTPTPPFGIEPTEVPPTFYYTPPPTTATSTPAGTPTATHMPGAEDYRLSTLKMIDDLNGWGTFRLDDRFSEQYWLGITDDGARTWLNVNPPFYEAERSDAIPNMYILGAIQIEPYDSERAWAYTRCLFLTACNFTPGIWRTDDGGHTWQTMHVPSDCAGVESDCVPDTLQFVDPQHGWVYMMQAGRNSISYHLYRTTDGGVTWQALPRRPDWISGFTAATKPLFLDETLGVRLQTTGTSPADFYVHQPIADMLQGGSLSIDVTHTGGDSWFQSLLPIPTGLLDALEAQALPEDKYLLIEYTPLSIPSDPPLVSFRATFFLNWQGPQIYQVYYFSADRGRSWVVLSKPHDAFFQDAQNGWRLGSADPTRLEATTNGGSTWEPYPESWWEVGKVQDQTVAVHVTEGGNAREEIETAFLDDRLWPGQGVQLSALNMDSSLAGWGVEVGGARLCTHDGAQTWKMCIEEEDTILARAVPPDSEGVWSPAEPLPEELFHGEPVPPELQRWIENGLQFLPDVKDYGVGFNPFAYFCRSTDANRMGDNGIGVSRRCVIRFPTREGSVYGYYVGYWITYYSLIIKDEVGQVWPSTVVIDFVDEERGWRLLDTGTGLFRLEHTEDGGETWKLIKTVAWIGQLVFVSPEEGYALAFEPPTRDTASNLFFTDAVRPSALLHTLDGGRTWEELQPVIGP
jgi:hypothetical protein